MMAKVYWPNGKVTIEKACDDWIVAASKANIIIPTGCLRGSCGSCEIQVNGKVLRACISTIDLNSSKDIKVELISDSIW